MIKVKTKLGILSSCFCAMSFISFSPIVTEIAKSFPDYSLSLIQMMITLPSLMFIAFSPLSGKLMKHVPKKILAIISVSMYLISGIFNFFVYKSLILMLVGSAIMGCGTGILMPVINALICDNFESKDRGAMMGLNATFVALGGLTFTLASGQLARVGWRYSFLVFLLIIPILILMVLFLPNSKLVSTDFEQPTKVKVKFKINGYIFALFLIGFIYFCLQNAFTTNSSGYVDALNGGGTDIASFVSMMNPLGGIIGGIIFGFLSQQFKNQIETVSLTIAGLGFALAGLIQSMVTVLIGGFLIGAAYAIFNAAGTLLLSNKLSLEENEFTVSIYMAIVNLGASLSPYVVNSLSGIFNDTVFTKYILCGTGIILLASLSFLISLKDKNIMKNM